MVITPARNVTTAQEYSREENKSLVIHSIGIDVTTYQCCQTKQRSKIAKFVPVYKVAYSFLSALSEIESTLTLKNWHF